MLHSASIGLDVHARSISAAAFAFGTGGAVQSRFWCLFTKVSRRVGCRDDSRRNSYTTL